MFLQIKDTKTAKNLMLNLDVVAAVIEDDDSFGVAISIGGAVVNTGMPYEQLRQLIATRRALASPPPARNP